MRVLPLGSFAAANSKRIEIASVGEVSSWKMLSKLAPFVVERYMP